MDERNFLTTRIEGSSVTKKLPSSWRISGRRRLRTPSVKPSRRSDIAIKSITLGWRRLQGMPNVQRRAALYVNEMSIETNRKLDPEETSRHLNGSCRALSIFNMPFGPYFLERRARALLTPWQSRLRVCFHGWSTSGGFGSPSPPGTTTVYQYTPTDADRLTYNLMLLHKTRKTVKAVYEPACCGAFPRTYCG